MPRSSCAGLRRSPRCSPVVSVSSPGGVSARGVLGAARAAIVAGLRAEGRDVGLSSAVYNSGLDLGAIVGPAAGGVVSAAFGIPAMFQLLAIGSLVLYF